MKRKTKTILLLFLLLITGYALRVTPISASRIDELKTKIDERNKQIEEIQKEIDKYQEEINKNSKEADSLKTQIKYLESVKKKLLSDISLTQKKIESTGYTIDQLTLDIGDKEKDIDDKLDTLGEVIRNMNDAETVSLIEMILSQGNFSEVFNDIEKMENFQKEINDNINELKILKTSLLEEKLNKEKQKSNLEGLKSKLVDQKQLVEINKGSKSKLLTETKNKESNYKKLVAEKIKLREAFEKELEDFESQLKIEIDPTRLPSVGKGILKWPFSNQKMLECQKFKDSLGNIYCITQYFGNTPFATTNPQLYPRGTHKGIDFRAPIGTEVLASLSGVVKGTGDTDKVCPNASYGKWVLVEHNNGLTTIYAHLSLIKVSAGQNVATGDLIGYSGNSGSSTGPHLHFTVYATQGVQIDSFPSRACGGKMYTMPVAPLNSYLNPLSYL